jgi:hypothetical protein
MIFLKRSLTAAAFFLPLLVAFYFGICVVGGAISGAKSAIDHPDVQDKAALGSEAGRNFVRNNLGMIVIGACGASFLTSVAISFSGILPWCKKPSPPPPLP